MPKPSHVASEEYWRRNLNRWRETPKNRGWSPNRGQSPILSRERFEEVNPSPENCENSYTWNRAICRVEAKIYLFPMAIQTFADDGSGSHFDPIQIQLGVFENVVNSPMGSWAKPQLITILVHFERMHYFGVAWIAFFASTMKKKTITWWSKYEQKLRPHLGPSLQQIEIL